MKLFDGIAKRLVRQRPARAHDGGARLAVAGNVFFAVFAAVAMVGMVGYGFNTVLRGPVSGMTEITRRTVAESTVITSSRLAIVGATTYQTAGGDCDGDGLIEPLEYADAGANPHPVGGGWLPRGTNPVAWSLVPNSIDPWKTEYGYCAFDSGTAFDAAGCGGPGAKRLKGAPGKTQTSFVIISAGKNKRFETSCAGYVDANADGKPDVKMYDKPAGSDDIILPYTYAEANDLGNGLWTPDAVAPATETETKKNIEVKGSGTSTFSGPLQLTGAGGLILPGDPGDDTVTGPCNSLNDRQLRRNTSDPLNPVIEICDNTNSLGWAPITGTSGGGGGGGGGSGGGSGIPGVTGYKVAHWKFNETSGTTAFDSWGGSNGTLNGSPVWMPNGGLFGGAIKLTSNDSVVVPRNAYLEPTSFTVSFWLKADSSQPQWAGIIRKANNYVTGAWALYNDNYTPDLMRFSTESDSSYVNGGGDYRYPLNQWIYVVAIYDPAGTAPQKRVYIDGSLKSSVNFTAPLNYDPSSTGELIIGGGINGLLDDVRIYNYALSDAEIQKIYASGQSYLRTKSNLKSGPALSWGKEDLGQLGNGSLTGDRFSPAPIVDTANYKNVSAAAEHMCGVRSDGSVACWGKNSNGKLGAGSAVAVGAVSEVPVKVSGLSNAVKVVTSTTHSCALKIDGRIWCWGANGNGELGNDNNADSDVPVEVVNIRDFIDVAVSQDGSCGVRMGGEAWCWGHQSILGDGVNSPYRYKPQKVANVSDFVQISMPENGQPAACGVTKRGLAFCWGNETNGSFGNGATSAMQSTPSQVSNITDFKKVEIGDNSACGLRAGGRISCWGSDTAGQLGNGPGVTAEQNVPYAIPNISDWVDVAVAQSSACAIRSNGDAYCWGDAYALGTNGASAAGWPNRVMGGPFMQVDRSYQKAIAVVDISQRRVTPMLTRDFKKLSVTRSNACAIDQDQTAWCWGLDNAGQLGNGAVTGTKVSPSRVADAGPWAMISIGQEATSSNNTACGIKLDGALYCWGSDSNGQVGNGSTTGNQTSPVQAGVSDDQWSMVSVEGQTACAIKNNGELYCWGRGADGASGLGSNGDATSPTIVTEPGPWSYVNVGEGVSCAIKKNGDAYCTGSDANGGLGDDRVNASKNVFVKVATPGPFLSISASKYVTCGVKQDGSLWCWGDTNFTKLEGDGRVPAMVRDPGPWSSVSTLDNYICGTKADGTAWCWGNANADGQFGNGTTNTSSLPVQVAGGNDWTAIEVGKWNTCGMKADGSLWCWGDDTNGQLGNGAALTADQLSPSRVASFAKKPAWSWNASGSAFSPPAGVNPVITTARTISNSGSADGLRLAGSGAASLTQSTSANQMLIDASGTGASSQLRLSATGATSNDGDAIPNLVARWRMDEANGSAAAVDDVGGSNAVKSGTMAFAPAGGMRAGAATFTASNNAYLRAARDTKFETQAFTLSMWIKSSGAQQDWAGILTKTFNNNGGSTAHSYGIYYQYPANTNLRFHLGKSGASGGVTSASSIPTNTWTFVTASYDPSASAPQAKLYLNGNLNASATITDAVVYDTTSAGDLYIGTTQAAAGEKFNGSIDDVRFYNRPLSAAEVKQLYDSYAGSLNVSRVVGLDYAAGTLAFGRNIGSADKWISELPLRDLEIDSAGNVGIGTSGAVYAKLDVNGAVRVGSDTTCNSSKSGMIAYNSSVWQYCDSGGSWKNFGSGIGSSSSLWDVGPNKLGCSQWGCCGIKQDGYAYCWGAPYNGRLGNNQNTTAALSPVKVYDVSSAAGYNDWISMADRSGIRANGQAWTWGDNVDGQLGNTSQIAKVTPVLVYKDSASPTPSAGFADWVQMNVSETWAGCGIRSTGQAYCWGWFNEGQGGINVGESGEFRTQPVLVHSDVSATPWTDWKFIRTGGETTCGVRASGALYCWGKNGYGSVGDGTDTIRKRPVQVKDSAGTGYWTDWVDVRPATGAGTNCGVRVNGTGWCWGNGSSGELGDSYATHTPPGGSPGYSYLPTQVGVNCTVYTDWVSIKPGGNEGYDGVHVCGLRANGTLWCWGRGTENQIGDGGASNRNCPTQVKDSSGSSYWSDWVNVEPGSKFTCGQRANGTTWCWGRNNYTGGGQLGNGNTTSSSLPVQVQ